MSTQAPSSSDSSPSPLSAMTERQIMHRKKEQHRAQTRARMARYRLKLQELPEEEREEAVLRARAARARYRERNHVALLSAARSKRHAAYAEKYGEEALQAKIERKKQRQMERQERPRRCEHVKPARPTRAQTSGRRNADHRDDIPLGHHTAIIHPYQYVYPVTD